MAIDYNILKNRQVDVNSPINIDEQIIQIVIYNKFRTYEAYNQVLKKFGNIEPFANIKELEVIYYNTLIQLAQKYSVEVPMNDWIDKIYVPNTIIECYELEVASEINNITMYNHLLGFASTSDLTDMLFRLQAVSFNSYLPAFRFSIKSFYSNEKSSFDNEDIMQKIQEYQKFIDNIISGNIDENMISKLFSSISFQFLGGAATGATLVALIKQFLENQNSNKE